MLLGQNYHNIGTFKSYRNNQQDATV